MSVFKKFNEKIDVEGLKNDLQETSSNVVEREKLPDGMYECSFEKIECKESKNGYPMLSIWFKVINNNNSKYNGNFMFYNQVLHTAIGLSNAMGTLEALEPETEVVFENFEQFEELIYEIGEVVAERGYEYKIKQVTNGEYTNYYIQEIFD